ncbi:uracil-DNA glycosylase family 4 [Rhodoplanes tepidamans]|nr:uracil-DNA glycosylase family 4 [Rhodoplanes tepidamans]
MPRPSVAASRRAEHALGSALEVGPAEPDRDCPRCPRLVEFRETWRAKRPDWENAPVPSFGPVEARLLIVGLAPGLQGANRTGRPFTGDYAGDLLYATLTEFGFATGTYAARPDDGLTLIDARITNAVRCVPPENKPTGPEIATCRPFLVATMAEMPKLAAIVALGRIAHDTLMGTLGWKKSARPFGHGAVHAGSHGTSSTWPQRPLTVFDSYHCSRYNTNTGVLTPAMFRAVFSAVRAHVDGAAAR